MWSHNHYAERWARGVTEEWIAPDRVAVDRGCDPTIGGGLRNSAGR